MDIPNSVNVLGIPYKIERGGCEPDEDGYCSPSKRVIGIREGLCREKEAMSTITMPEFPEVLMESATKTVTRESFSGITTTCSIS